MQKGDDRNYVFVYLHLIDLHVVLCNGDDFHQIKDFVFFSLNIWWISKENIIRTLQNLI